MTTGAEAFRRIQAMARSSAARTGSPAPTQDLLVRHVLESFVDRLSRTTRAQTFVLKGGILLAAYGVRRSTRDVDANAVSTELTAAGVADVVCDIAAVDLDDGVVFDLDTIAVGEIREAASYPGLRVRVAASVGAWTGKVVWDVSTGDPIVPAPQRVRIERLLGGVVEVLGYAPETVLAEKGVTILERGSTSTRWRDYVDIARLAGQGFDPEELLRSARAVARHRGVTLEPVAPYLRGHDALAQAKWAAWRRKEGLETVCEPELEDQVELVASCLDPVFVHGPAAGVPE